MYPAEGLTRGRCYACNKVYMNDREIARKKANDRALSEAARRFMAEVGSASKGDAMRPQMLKGFLDAVGGTEKFGNIVAGQFLKCSGLDANGEEDPSGDWKPQIAAKFAEIITRTIGQEDDKQGFDPSGLSDDDLQSVLQGLLLEQAKKNPAFCEAALGIIMQENPRLVQDAIDPKPIEAESVEKVKIDLSEVGIDEKDAGEHE